MSRQQVIWATRKNNQSLSFNVGALLFKLICSRLIPTTHTSHVTLDRFICHDEEDEDR